MKPTTVEYPTKALAEFVASTGFDDIPAPVVHEAKRLILDVIGCALGGYMTDIGSMSVNLARSIGGKPEATIIGSGDRTSCVEAARANRRMANALDADDTFMTIVHFGAHTVSSALAAGERAHASGKDLIACVAIGFDVGARFGISIGPPLYDLKALDYIGSRMGGQHLVESLASASAAGKALGLTKEQIAYAFGMACTDASIGQVTKRRSATMSNYKGPCTESMGVIAALFAQIGMTVDDGILDGEYGVWKTTGAPKCDLDLMVGRLGEKWYLPDTTYKPWPSCRLIHSPLTAFVRILKENNLKAEEIEKVLVRVHAVLAGQPRFRNKNPVGMVNCEFNMPHSFAMVALGVRPGPGWYAPEMINGGRVQEFRQKVDVELDPSPLDVRQWIKDGHYTKWPASVEVRARGSTYKAFTEYAKGDPWDKETYFTDEELQAKFRNMAAPLGVATESWRARLEKIVNMVYELEKVPQIADLTGLLSR